MRRVFVPFVIAALAAAMLVSAGGAVGAAPTRSIHTKTAKAHLAGVVDVSKLPKVTPHAGSSLRTLPFRTAGGAASPAHRALAPKASPRSPLVTVSLGTVLGSALKSSDNTVGLTPPDMGVAVGSGKTVQMVNIVGRIWTGTTPGPVFALDSFFLATGNSQSDPWVHYDAISGRFFAGIFDITVGGEDFAISKTSDPSGAWWIYQITYPSTFVTGGGCPDQGKMGVDDDTVGLGFNEFSATGCAGGGGSFLGAAIEVFPKAAMMAGSGFSFNYTDPLAGYHSLVPAQSMTATTTLQFASISSASASGTLLHRVTSVGVPPGASLTALPDLTIGAYAKPPTASQKGTTSKLTTGDDRVQNVVWRSGTTALAFTDKCTPSGDTKARACARVVSYTDAGVIKQNVDLSKLKHWYFFPAVGVTSANNIAVTFADSAKKTFPQLMAAAGPIAGGAFSSVILLKAGTSANLTTRYGDYFAVAVDPAATTNVWVAGEIGGPSTGAWQTAVAQVIIT